MELHNWYIAQHYHIGSHALIMASGHDQSDELSMLDSGDGSVSPQDISKWALIENGLTVQLEYLVIRCLDNVQCTVVHLDVELNFHIINIKFKYYFPVIIYVG